MLKRTFIHLPGVGPRRETHSGPGLATWRISWPPNESRPVPWPLDWLKAELTGSLDHTQDAAYFADRLQPESTGASSASSARTAYLDIETTAKPAGCW